MMGEALCSFERAHLSREGLFDIERRMLDMPQVKMRLVHHFAPGLYARELHIPKGVRLTGKLHKFAHLNFMLKGDLSVLLEDGIHRVIAPFTVVSPPGTKRIAYAHQATIWTTVLPTEETDPDIIEEQFTANSEQEFLAFCEEHRKKIA